MEKLDKQRLVVVVMGQNCEKFIEMCLESVKSADAIIYCDGGSKDKTLDLVDNFFTNIMKQHNEPGKWHYRIIKNKYDQKDKQMNGKQRNFYLNYLKENHPDDWCLCIDADEVVENLNKIKEFIKNAEKGLYSVKMRHFHNDLGHEDATQEVHYVLNRLFTVNNAGEYPEVEHPVLLPKISIISETEEIPKTAIGITNCTTIWHLAHINHCFNIKNRYEKNLKHSNIHSPEFLDWWKDAHTFGNYPNKSVNPLEIPDIILKNFHIEKDKYYFKDRVIELKHFIDVINYMNYYNLNKRSRNKTKN